MEAEAEAEAVEAALKSTASTSLAIIVQRLWLKLSLGAMSRLLPPSSSSPSRYPKMGDFLYSFVLSLLSLLDH